MRRPLVPAVAVVALVVLAGCGAVLGPDGPKSDPGGDKLGWENGYWYDDPLSVTPEDGYNASEREAVVARAMARVEEIRRLEFNETVPVTVLTRQQYLANRSGGGGSETYNNWNNQVWEGLFIVGEEADTASSFNSTLGATVQGYYAPGRGEIVLVSDSPTPTIDRGTLAHELVHALQDQRLELGGSPDTQDAQLAVDGVVEGDPNYVQRRYVERCGSEWRCIPAPERTGGGDAPAGYNRGLFLAIYQPYATGPEFIAAIKQTGGWSAVNDLYDAFPNSTEQTIHPELYPQETPVDVRVRDRSNSRWDRFDRKQQADTVGEASIYAMFVANGVVSVDRQSVYRYQSTPSAGWGGDALVPYKTGRGDYGYVWKTVWDTPADAREFHEAYLALLDAHGARNPRENVYVVPKSDAFADAFRVVRTGKTVRIVNAPDVGTLDKIHSGG